ncbi:MAG TPA: hypothetical protein VNO35_26320 [Steroidobacteraceae bacterium]|nr:hypothetical protein [Steroidobacteraceae bacterium]
MSDRVATVAAPTATTDIAADALARDRASDPRRSVLLQAPPDPAKQPF